jgi:hypothetical protein
MTPETEAKNSFKVASKKPPRLLDKEHLKREINESSYNKFGV